MSAQLNHTIVWCRDKKKSSAFLVDLLGLQKPVVFGPMLVVQLANGVSLDFYEQEGKISSQHYAFLVSEEEFDRAFAHIKALGLEYWADPGKQRSGEIYRLHGGRGVYFEDPDKHLLEVMTKPYTIAS